MNFHRLLNACRYSLASLAANLVMWWVSYHPISIEFPYIFSLYIFFYSEILLSNLLRAFSVAILPQELMNRELYDIEILFKLKQGQDRFQLTVEPFGMGRVFTLWLSHKQAGLGSQNFFKHHYLISFNRLCVRNILNCQEKTGGSTHFSLRSWRFHSTPVALQPSDFGPGVICDDLCASKTNSFKFRPAHFFGKIGQNIWQIMAIYFGHYWGWAKVGCRDGMQTESIGTGWSATSCRGDRLLGCHCDRPGGQQDDRNQET